MWSFFDSIWKWDSSSLSLDWPESSGCGVESPAGLISLRLSPRWRAREAPLNSFALRVRRLRPSLSGLSSLIRFMISPKEIGRLENYVLSLAEGGSLSCKYCEMVEPPSPRSSEKSWDVGERGAGWRRLRVTAGKSLADSSKPNAASNAVRAWLCTSTSERPRLLWETSSSYTRSGLIAFCLRSLSSEGGSWSVPGTRDGLPMTKSSASSEPDSSALSKSGSRSASTCSWEPWFLLRSNYGKAEEILKPWLLVKVFPPRNELERPRNEFVFLSNYESSIVKSKPDAPLDSSWDLSSELMLSSSLSSSLWSIFCTLGKNCLPRAIGSSSSTSRIYIVGRLAKVAAGRISLSGTSGSSKNISAIETAGGITDCLPWLPRT